MKRAPSSRAHRGQVGLMKNEAGYWSIRWGRSLARRAGLPFRESTGTRNRAEADRILDRRRIEVYRSLGDDEKVRAVTRDVAPIGIDLLVSDYLRAYAAGELPGAKPAKSTVDLYVSHFLGQRGGLVPYAVQHQKTMTTNFDALFVQRWIEAESRRVANDTLRMKLVVARQLATYGCGLGLVLPDVVKAIKALHPAASALGRARVDGVPSMPEVERLLAQMRPKWKGDRMRWDKLAELQLRLGIRRAEVMAMEESWLEPARATIVIRVSGEPGEFDTKSHASRSIDGVDDLTFELAREMVAMKRRFGATATGYREAWDRACARLEKAGTPWLYRNKSHSLRSVYATQSRHQGVPLPVVQNRMGHSSERVTERHYIGRTNEVVPGPFSTIPLIIGHLKEVKTAPL